MIAKRVPRQGGHSSIKHLAEYILDIKHGGQKVAHAWTSNLSVPDDFQLGIIETQATQMLNYRSKIDKTYHLVISLAEGEKLSAEQFREIEQRFCEAIGLGEHQRICAIHQDTDNLHLHIAMSKVHPVTLNTIEPYYDKFKLQEVCRECEKVYGLQVDVGRDRSGQLNPVEVHQGLQSFQSWIKANFREKFITFMKDPGHSWQDVQELAGKYGIELREHGRGLVFSHVSEKIFVKASSIDLNFTKKFLEDRLGPFERAAKIADPIMKYQRGPIEGNEKSNELYAAYQNQMAKIRCGRKERLVALVDQRSTAIAEIKLRYAQRRQQVKLDPILTRAKKFEIRKSLSANMKSEIDRYFKEMQREQRAIRESNITQSWKDWVHDQAKEGNEAAIEILQQRTVAAKVKFGNGHNLQENQALLDAVRRLRVHQTTKKSDLQHDKGLER